MKAYVGLVVFLITGMGGMVGCAPDPTTPTVEIVKPLVPANLCQNIPPLYPGCQCPPAPCASGVTPHLVVTYTSGPPLGDDGDPFIIPLRTVDSNPAGHKPPKPKTVGGNDWDSTLTITIEVDTNGVAIPSVALHLEIDAADSRSMGSDSLFGHRHKSATTPKPKGQLSNADPTTSTENPHKATVVYTPGQFSEPVTLVISSPGVDTLRKHWTVGVPNLVPMTGSYIDLVGEINPHPHSHYVVSTMIPTLDSLAAYFHQVYSTNLQINDMSLRYGGKFDLDTMWRVDTAHIEHRLGRSADINGVSDSLKYHKVILWWTAADTGLYFAPERRKAHLRDWRHP